MSNVRYEQVGEDFDRVRGRRPEAQKVWCQRIADYLPDRRIDAVVDVGAGTGIWARALAEWFGTVVHAVEPVDGMREQATQAHPHPNVCYVAGRAEALPLADASVDAAWLSTVVHQLPDVAAAARELRRVLRPSSPVMVRGGYPGRHEEIELFHVFPEALAVAEAWPRLGRVITAFEDAGFTFVSLERVREPSFDSYDEVFEVLPAMRRSDTVLVDLDEAAWEAGVARLRRARDRGEQPWELGLDLLVMA